MQTTIGKTKVVTVARNGLRVSVVTPGLRGAQSTKLVRVEGTVKEAHKIAVAAVRAENPGFLKRLFGAQPEEVTADNNLNRGGVDASLN